MAVTSNIYSSLFLSLANKEVNLNSDSLKVMLCTSAYTPNQGTDRYKAAVTNEVVGTGYTAGGVALSSVTVSLTGNVLTLTAAAAAWAASTLTARYAVIYDSTPATDATRPLIAFANFGADVSTTGATFTYTPNASGILTLTAA
jgi:hypothetical protein